MSTSVTALVGQLTKDLQHDYVPMLLAVLVKTVILLRHTLVMSLHKP